MSSIVSEEHNEPSMGLSEKTEYRIDKYTDPAMENLIESLLTSLGIPTYRRVARLTELSNKMNGELDMVERQVIHQICTQYDLLLGALRSFDQKPELARAIATLVASYYHLMEHLYATKAMPAADQIRKEMEVTAAMAMKEQGPVN